jgi:hypothetical protein
VLDFYNLSFVLHEVDTPSRGFLKGYYTVHQDSGKAFSSLSGKAGGLRYIISSDFDGRFMIPELKREHI